MSFTPVVPFGGYPGWSFLIRSREAQKAAFVASASVQRDEAYFREKIGGVSTAQALVADRRLVSVALAAFGLEADIDNRYFLRKVLEDGTLKSDALGNKLADKRYLEFSKAFGFGDYATPRTVLSDFADTILASYETRRFEAAVGAQDNSMRLALNAERELGALARRAVSDDAKWFHVMGLPPLREVFQTAFGLPASFAALDLDRQMDALRNRAERVLGSSEISQFSDPERIADLVRLYLLRAETSANAVGYSPRSAALALLQTVGARESMLSRRI